MLSKALLCAVPFVASQANPQAMTENGKVEGTDNAGFLGNPTVEAFYGIPYAAPPVGENRLRPPQPFVDSWAPNTRNAKKEGKPCHTSEDCLVLNVHRPVGADDGSDIPTIVWIHGGGFAGGDALHVTGHKENLLRLYDPTNIVERHGHVFVGLNYRLSSLGFLALPELEAENPENVAGNMGLLDQRAALQWVQRNVRGFGGDPQKVTIQGESAGAMSVMFHLTSPGSSGLFHGAISESPTIRQGCYFQDKKDSFAFAREWTALRGCPQSGLELLQCLRQLDESEFRKDLDIHAVADWNARRKHRKDKNATALPADIPEFACPLYPMNWGVVVDGTSAGLPDWPEKLLEAGEFNRVPLINGANINGGAMFAWALPLLWGDWPYPVDGSGPLQIFNISNLRHMGDLGKMARWFLRNTSDQDKFVDLYGTGRFDDHYVGNESNDTWIIDRMNRFWRDSFFLCPSREIATHWSSHAVPVYEYVFSFEMHTNVLPLIKDLWSTHGFELPFVFRNWVQALGMLFRHPDQYKQMTDVMSCTWASFVKCQKPKCQTPPPSCEHVLEDVPEWPKFSPQDRKYISLKHNTTIETIRHHVPFPDDEFPGDDRCDFWKTVDFSWQDTIRTWPADSEDTLLV